MAAKKTNRWAPVVTVIILLLALFLVRQIAGEKQTTRDNPKTEKSSSRGLNRNPSNINYSKHARCRMECRHITQREVKQILEEGKINYGKSELGDRPDCKRRYAVEGKTEDGQRVRIIFAPCQSEVTVVTVIDLGKEWPCECD